MASTDSEIQTKYKIHIIIVTYRTLQVNRRHDAKYEYRIDYKLKLNIKPRPVDPYTRTPLNVLLVQVTVGLLPHCRASFSSPMNSTRSFHQQTVIVSTSPMVTPGYSVFDSVLSASGRTS